MPGSTAARRASLVDCRSIESVRIGLCGLCVWLLLAFAPCSALAYCRLTTESEDGECVPTGIPLAWECGTVRYSVCSREKTTPPFDRILDAVDESFQTWEDVVCEGRHVGFSFIRRNDPHECDRHEELLDDPDANWSPEENLVVFVPDWEAYGHDPWAFAVAATFYIESTGQIVNADIDVNDSGLPGAIALCGHGSGQCSHDSFDLRNVLTHEIGHMLGLAHSKEPGAAMLDTAQLGETSKRNLTSDDIEGLCSIYPKGSLLDCDILQNRGCGCSSIGGRVTDGGSASGIAILVLGLSRLMRRRRRRSGQHWTVSARPR